MTFTVSEPSIFGPIVTVGDVEQWTLDLLKRWLSTYLAEVERQHGIVAGKLPRPRGWALGPTFDKWPEDQVPGVLVSSPGTATRPVHGGDGAYRVRWAIEPGVLCSGRTQAETHELAGLYGGALRTLMLQRPSLDGHAAGVDWLGETYSDLPYDDTRTLYAVRCLFTVEVDGVAYAGAGPLTPDVPLDPDTGPWPDWPIAETVDVQVEAVDPIPQPEGGTEP